MQISNWLSAQVLNSMLRGVAFSPPAGCYVALYKSDPTAADTGQEVAGNGYERQVVAFTAAAVENGKQTTKNTADIEFPIFTGDVGLITHIGLRTAKTGGNLLFSRPLDNAKTFLANDKVKMYKDSIVVRFGQ
ncbi:phage tail fiber protein [Saccharibacillus brassicae]|uniref:Uncharacterized protein n=1 Tax=Saccharibacillus brassicae TaxID=2583377 RepID=A0A4Y6V490_SACBS|nr:hypothetical protein [Saccharibacillus brassicae]QDH23451.1 hypothetical protein FFV09_22840 [Saccharibacillus brassicae]